MRRGYLLPVLAVALLGTVATAADVSGVWRSSFTLGDEGRFLSTLDLGFGLAEGWRFSGSWALEGMDLRWGTLKLQGSLGVADVAAGIALQLEGDPRVLRSGSLFTLEGAEIANGFISLKVYLEDFTLGITVTTGP